VDVRRVEENSSMDEKQMYKVCYCPFFLNVIFSFSFVLSFIYIGLGG
jgi:hypothetical protein